MKPIHVTDYKTRLLGKALLAYMTLIIVAITLIPFDFRIPDQVHVFFSGDVSDAAENILLFFPLGFLYSLASAPSGRHAVVKALWLGAGVSICVETCQIFLPGRYCSAVDVATNALGSGLGGAAAEYLLNRRGRRQDGLFVFKTPLMDVLYLLTPLMWLSCLSLGGEPGRFMLCLVLGVFGIGIIASIHVNRHAFGNPALAAAGWFLLGALPAAPSFPLHVGALAVGAGAAAKLSVRLRARFRSKERRFEWVTLKKLFPVFALYLVLASVWPTRTPLGRWPLGVDFGRLSEAGRIVFIFRFIEVIAAFTLLGYIIGAMRGRIKETFLKTLCHVVADASIFSILMALLRDFISGPYAFAMEVALFSGASVYGAVIHRLQLAALIREMKAVRQAPVSTLGRSLPPEAAGEGNRLE